MQSSTSYLSLLFFIVLISFSSCTNTVYLKSGEGFVDVKGGKIWYHIIGEGNKTPLLLMHGGPGGTHRYFYQLSSLSEDRPIILFDQLGTGRSGFHKDTTLLTIPNFVEQVHQLKEKLHLKEFYLLGHSWGAALELEYYQKHPEGVKGIVFSSPYVSTPAWRNDAKILISKLPDSIQGIIHTAEQTNNYTTPEYKLADSLYWSRYGLRNGEKEHSLDTIDAPSNSFIYNYMWGPSEFTATGTLKNYDNANALSTISVPVLFITGEYDEARPETVQKFQQMVPNSKFRIIQNAGHTTMRDNTHQYNKAVRDFLNSLEKE